MHIGSVVLCTSLELDWAECEITLWASTLHFTGEAGSEPPSMTMRAVQPDISSFSADRVVRLAWYNGTLSRIGLWWVEPGVRYGTSF